MPKSLLETLPVMPGSDDGVFLKILAYFGRGVQIHAFPRPGRYHVTDHLFFLRPWTQECHVHWTQETWTRKNKIVCFYANLLRPICCADQSGYAAFVT